MHTVCENADRPLRRLIHVIVADNDAGLGAALRTTPSLARLAFARGSTRAAPRTYYLEAIGLHIYEGDTALHVAAAAYRHLMIGPLLHAGADVRARNRRGSEPLHAASVGTPGAHGWNPAAQALTIQFLLEHGADANARNRDGATPLHRAVRTRCAAAVRMLLAHGADVMARNNRGSTALDLAGVTSGRSGAGSPDARAQLVEIRRLLGQV